MNEEFDPAARDTLELRVLQGPQAGARLALERDHAYSIGAGDTCAIVLHGPQVAPEHALLSATEEGITIVPMQGTVGTSSGPVQADGAPLPLGTVMQFGLVKLTAARANDEWPLDETAAPMESTANSPAMSRAGTDRSPNKRLAHARAERKHQSRRRRRFALACAGAVAAVMVIVGSGFWGSVSEAKPLRAAAAAPAAAASSRVRDISQNVMTLVKGFPAGALNAQRRPDGSWLIQGRVASLAERESLKEAASALEMPVEIRVIADPERRAAINRFASSNQLAGRVELQVQPGIGDMLRIVGAAASADDVAALQARAGRELKDFGPYEFEILLPNQLRERFLSLLRAAGLDSKMKIVSIEPRLKLQAILAPAEVKGFETMFADFTRQYGAVLAVDAQVFPEAEAIAATVSTVVGGPFPFIVTTSGQRVAPGGSLAGHTVVSVRDGEILLSEGVRVRYGP
jgi:type III secretion system YscD/HrpQ family protein